MAELLFKVLPKSDWPRLADHPMLQGIGLPNDDMGEIVVCEKDGEIIGFHMLILVPHLEPIWVAPEYRNTIIPGRLWKQTVKLLDDLRIKMAYVFSVRPDTDGYLQRLGLRELPYKTFLHDPDGLYPSEPIEGN